MQKLTLVRYEIESDAIISEYDCNFVANCDGTSIWGNTKNKKVRVKSICVVHNIFDGNIVTHVSVAHNANWEIYTDRGFERAISDALGFDVAFTEQGMQEDNIASMEC